MSMPAPMTLTAKILKQHAISPSRSWVAAGDLLRVRVDWALASELAWNGMERTYEALGRPGPRDPNRFYLAIDHTVDPVTLATDKRVQRLVKLSRDFARESGIKHFYDANETILHTTFYRDLVRPGELVLGADSHTTSHGGFGAVSIGLGGADVTVAMVLGESWLEVPEAIAIDYSGELPFGLGGKDVILRTLGELGRNTVAMERSVEYLGDATKQFSVDTRFTICNMTAEFGGLNGIFVPDDVTVAAAKARSEEYRGGEYLAPDPDAPYVSRHAINLARLVPQVAKPYSPDNVIGVDEVGGTPLDGVFVGACNTTEEELVLAALVLDQQLRDGLSPAPNNRRLVVPGNREIERRLKERGLLDIYERAGFRIGPPGCSMCLGIASDRAGEGEVWLSSQNRNFPNRMGKGSHAWLASAATAAASALSMRIADPRKWLARIDPEHYATLLAREPGSSAGRSAAKTNRASIPAAEVVPRTSPDESGGSVASPVAGQTTIYGKAQCFGDHIDTDAIIPGEFCHLTDLDALGSACFHHTRPDFKQRVQRGQNIVVAGEGWGSGSSREQAVWALKGAGVLAIIARSFAYIHKRNLINEALPFFVVSDESFYSRCQDDADISIDTATSEIRLGRSGETYRATARSAMVRTLTACGGLVEVVKRHGPATFDVLQRPPA